MITEDYIVRMIRDFGRMMARLLLGRKSGEPPVLEAYRLSLSTGPASLPQQLLELTDQGKLNEAEDLLFEDLDFTDPENCSIVLAFYDHLASLSPERLAACDYSKEEILEGLGACAKRFGLSEELTQGFVLSSD